MDEIETLAKALAFEYFVGVEHTMQNDNITSQHALNFFMQNEDEYLTKATKIFELLAENHIQRH